MDKKFRREFIDSGMESNERNDQLSAAVFGNSLIMTEIFKNISSFQEVKNFRLVSPLWNEISLRKWRQIATLRLLRNKDKPRCCNCCRHPPSSLTDYLLDTISFTEYLQLLKNSEEGDDRDGPVQLFTKPFSRFRIINCSLHKPSNEEDEDLQRFWSECGPSMKYLNLDHCTIDPTKCSQVLRRVLLRLPILEEFEVVLVPIQYDDDDDDDEGGSEMSDEEKLAEVKDSLEALSFEFCYETDYEELCETGENMAHMLTLFPNVKNLNLNTRDYNILQALPEPTIRGQPIKLRRLTFSPNASMTTEHFYLTKEYFRSVKPPLETMKVIVDSTIVKGHGELRKLLKCCRKSLRELEMLSYPKSTQGESLSYLLRNICFQKLTKLCLRDEPVISFSALRGCPKLKSISILFDRFHPKRKWNQLIARDEKLDSGKMKWVEMEHLRIDYGRLDLNSLLILASWMPNMKVIQLHLRKVTESMIREIFPNLEEVTNLSGR